MTRVYLIALLFISLNIVGCNVIDGEICSDATEEFPMIFCFGHLVQRSVTMGKKFPSHMKILQDVFFPT